MAFEENERKAEYVIVENFRHRTSERWQKILTFHPAEHWRCDKREREFMVNRNAIELSRAYTMHCLSST